MKLQEVETEREQPKINIVTRTPRLLLAVSALLSVVGGALHAAPLNRALVAVAAANLRPFYANSFKALWLGDSTTLFILGGVFALIATRSSAASKPLVVALALISAAVAVLIYTFLGSFFAGHLLLAIAALAFIAGLKLPGPDEGSTFA